MTEAAPEAAAAAPRKGKQAAAVASVRPIARVLPMLEPAHLDRDFDYLVPAEMDALAQPGVRVRVRFSGRLIDGFILDRLDHTDHTGKLMRLERVVSGEQVLTPEILRLVTAVAARCAGTRADVLRLAIPPRHARVESEKPRGQEDSGAASVSEAVVNERASGESGDGRSDSVGTELDSASIDASAEAVEKTSDTGRRASLGPESDSVWPGPNSRAGGARRAGGPEVVVSELDSGSSGVIDGADGVPVDGEGASRGRVGATADPASPVDLSRYAGWEKYRHGMSFLSALAGGKGPRAAWQAVPGEEWARRLAELAAVVVGSGRSAVLIVPDQRDLDRLSAACAESVGDAAVGLAAGLGPAARYRRWLAILRGTARVVIGTRSAVFAPARDLGLIAIWDDGDDTYAEPRAPYPHAREVAMLRAHETGAAFVAGGFARTAEIQAVVASGWAHDLIADRAVVRRFAPRISAPGDSDVALERDPVAQAVRIPAVAFTAARKALAAGQPVLVQVPRRGYVPALACAKCRVPARCRHCNGPLALPDTDAPRSAKVAARHNDPTTRPSARRRGTTTDAGAAARAMPFDESAAATGERRDPSARPEPRAPAARPPSARELGVALSRSASEPVAHSPSCRWCGKTEPVFRCGSCGSRALRAVVIGAARTAEELGRAFPEVPIRASGGAAVLDAVSGEAQVVVATIGAEPATPDGYGVALLLDGWALLGRADLRAAEDALRRWMSAATLVRSSGQVIVMAEPSVPTVQALVRWDPVGHARFELESRTEVRFPPAVRFAAIDGTTESIAELLGEAQLPDGVEMLGPVPLPPGARKPFSSGDSPAEVERMILRADRARGAALARALGTAQAVRSTHRSDAPLRVQIDPIDIG